jgi:hypothetical protein
MSLLTLHCGTRALLALLTLSLLAGCSDDASSASSPLGTPWARGVRLPAEPQSVGLGNSRADFIAGLGGGAASQLTPEVIGLLGLSAEEDSHMQRMLRVAKVVGPETVMRTVGNNPAETLAT